MFKSLLIVGACALLCACQANGGAQARHIPPGTSLELHQALSVPPERGSLVFQDGQQQSAVDQYRPHCRFVVELASITQTIDPDRFEVERVKRFALGTLAALPDTSLALFGDGGGPSDTPYITELWLASTRQPAVVRLTCQQWQDPSWPESEHLTVAEIQAALGAVFTLRLPQ